MSTYRLYYAKTALPYVIMGSALLAGLVRGFNQWHENKPEWSYYQMVYQPLIAVTGPDKPIFGYLPGCKALLAPFVWTEPVGYVVFAFLNAFSCIGICRVTYWQYTDDGKNPLPRGLSLLWFSICSAVPFWFALQNNQLVGPAVFLTLFAFSLVAQRRDLLAGAVFSCAILLKTLPLPVLLLPLLYRRWKTALMAGMSLAILSIGLACITEGIDEGVLSHMRWPSQVMAQNPMKVLVDNTVPASFYSNQSPAAEIVRLARNTGIDQLVWIHTTVLVTFFLVLVACSLRTDHGLLFWYKVAGWLAWVAYAAPYGRYYYLLFLVPALYVLGLRAFAHSGARRHFCWVWLGALSSLLLAARSHNALYAIVSLFTLLLFLTVLISEQMMPHKTG